MTEARALLAGLKVLDLTYVWAGPGTGMYLADQGADVVKIEPPAGAPNLGTRFPDGSPTGD